MDPRSLGFSRLLLLRLKGAEDPASCLSKVREQISFFAAMSRQLLQLPLMVEGLDYTRGQVTPHPGPNKTRKRPEYTQKARKGREFSDKTEPGGENSRWRYDLDTGLWGILNKEPGGHRALGALSDYFTASYA